jgi:hypothetical protein
MAKIYSFCQKDGMGGREVRWIGVDINVGLIKVKTAL